MLLCVFVVAEQATVEQAKVDDEAEMTHGKVDEAAGGVICKKEKALIKLSLPSWTHAQSPSHSLHQFAHGNLAHHT